MDKLIELIPSLLWYFFAVFALLLFYRPIRDNLLPRLGGFKAMGVELSFLEDSMDDASIELAQKFPGSSVRVSVVDKRRILNRVKRHLDILENARILWVDDHPENNSNERDMFRQLKTEIDIATSSEEALEILNSARYDLVLSDMVRGEEVDAGLRFLEQFRKSDDAIPVILYIDKLDLGKGTPAKAFGITNRPDELLHLTLDALERKKY